MAFVDELQADLDDIASDWPLIITFNGIDIPARKETGRERVRVPGHDAMGSSLSVMVREVDVTTTAKDTPVVVNGREWLLFDVEDAGLLCLLLHLRSKSAPIPRRSL